MIEQLHKEYPEARIDFLLKKGIEGVFQGHPFLHELIVWDKARSKYQNYLKILRKVRSERYDLVVNLQRFLTTGLITTLSGARIKAGFDKNPMSWFFTHKVPHQIGPEQNPKHETQRNLMLIKSFTEKGGAKVKLYPGDADRLHIAGWVKEKFITIAPASLWFTKQWPAGKWLEFIRALDDSIFVYLLGSKADTALCQKLINESGRMNVVDFSGKLSFLQSAALMEHALMNFVNDSAPMHLASAVNAPVAAIFCSTVKEFGFGPLSDMSYIIEIKENLSCRPCGLHGRKACPEKHFKCAKEIKTEQLLEVLDQITEKP